MYKSYSSHLKTERDILIIWCQDFLGPSSSCSYFNLISNNLSSNLEMFPSTPLPLFLDLLFV